MGSGVKTPKYDLSAAQNEQVWAAEQNRKYGNVNVDSGLGGYEWITNPDGTQTVKTNLSGNDQQRLNLIGQSLAGIDIQQPDLSKIRDFNMDGQSQADAAYDMATRYLNRDFESQTDKMSADLAAKGIPIGSKAYTDAMAGLQDSQNRALGEAADNAIFRGQEYSTNALNQLGTQANLLTGINNNQIGVANAIGSGITNPVSSMVQGPGGDFGNNYNTFYNASYQRAQDKLGARGANISALGQTGGAAAGAAGAVAIGQTGGAAAGAAAMGASDRRLKENIDKVGEVDGVAIYKFDYKPEAGGEKNQIGVIAQEIMDILPNAVLENEQGYLFVDYAKLPKKIWNEIEKLRKEK